MAAALARRGGGGLARALARGRGMCSATAAERAAGAALTSEELMRMERERSAHKYGLPLDPPLPFSFLPRSLVLRSLSP